MISDKFNLGSLLKNAKKMQELVGKTQEELAHIVVVGEAGAGAVKVTMTARHMIQKLEIDDDILSENKSILEDLLIAAINDASKKAEEITQSKMLDASKFFGGMGDTKAT